MIGRIIASAVKGFKKFLQSDLYRRAFSHKHFPEDSQARSPNVPTIGDHADVDVRRTSGDEFIMTVARGKGQLEGMQDRMDMELTKHRQEHNYVLDENERPSIREMQRQHIEERLDELHEQVKEDEE